MGFPLPYDEPCTRVQLSACYLTSTADGTVHYLVVHLKPGRYDGGVVLAESTEAGGRYDHDWNWHGGVAADAGYTQSGSNFSFDAAFRLCPLHGVVVLLNSRPDQIGVGLNAAKIPCSLGQMVPGAAIASPGDGGSHLAYAIVWGVLVVGGGAVVWQGLGLVRRGTVRCGPGRSWVTAVPVLDILIGVAAVVGTPILLHDTWASPLSRPESTLSLSWKVAMEACPAAHRWFRFAAPRSVV